MSVSRVLSGILPKPFACWKAGTVGGWVEVVEGAPRHHAGKLGWSGGGVLLGTGGPEERRRACVCVSIPERLLLPQLLNALGS